jgi:hypothetical protein
MYSNYEQHFRPRYLYKVRLHYPQFVMYFEWEFFSLKFPEAYFWKSGEPWLLLDDAYIMNFFMIRQ